MLTTKMTEQGLELYWSGEVDVDTLEDMTFLVYYRAFSIARENGFPFPARIWNSIPEIHASHENVENYQRFCGGRKRAYDILDVSMAPTASAEASDSGKVMFSFLFSAEPLKNLEVLSR